MAIIEFNVETQSIAPLLLRCGDEIKFINRIIKISKYGLIITAFYNNTVQDPITTNIGPEGFCTGNKSVVIKILKMHLYCFGPFPSL